MSQAASISLQSPLIDSIYEKLFTERNENVHFGTSMLFEDVSLFLISVKL